MNQFAYQKRALQVARNEHSLCPACGGYGRGSLKIEGGLLFGRFVSRELFEFVVDTLVKPVAAVAVAKVTEAWWRKRHDRPSEPDQPPPENESSADDEPRAGR